MPRLAQPAAVRVTLATAAPAPAQEVKWRHDYAAARKEATDTGRLDALCPAILAGLDRRPGPR